MFGKDQAGNLSTILGAQRGVLRNPQGFMETPLPKEDLTGLKAQHASRVNGKTLELVVEDNSIEDNAIREIYEEAGIKINKSDLVLLGIRSDTTANPVCFTVQYMVVLENTPKLSTQDDEFVQDDLQRPTWIKIEDIKYNSESKKYFSPEHDVNLDQHTVDSINLGLKTLSLPTL